MAGAIDRLIGGDDALFDGGKRHDHFEGRAGRVGALYGFVHQGAVFGIEQRVVIRRRDAADKEVRVIAGRGGKRGQIAILAIDDDHGGAFLAQTGLHIALQIGVHGQLQIGPGLPLAPLQLAHHAARGVDLHMFGARRAAQQVFGAGFDVDLADLKARDAQHLIGVLQRVEVGLAHPAHAAHHMGEIRAARVDAGQAHFGRDAGQGGGVDADLAHDFPTHVINDGDGQEGGRARHFGHGAFAGLLVDLDDLGEPLHYGFHVARILADHDDPVGGHVIGKLYAVAVENLTPGGGDQADVDAVLFGQQAELVGLIDL